MARVHKVVQAAYDAEVASNVAGISAARKCGRSDAYLRLGVPESVTSKGVPKVGVADLVALRARLRAECRAVQD